jgi:hypothetical protein
MVQEQIRIEQIRTKALYEFALRVGDGTEGNGILPIGKPRALAYAANPCADENDIGLLVAYLGRECIGYLGIMPGLLRRGDQFSTIHWLSTWFVPPQFRKTSVGLQLVLKALSLQYDLVVCEMSGEAERVYRGLRFRELGHLHYYVINLGKLDPLSLGYRAIRKTLGLVGVRSEIPEKIVRRFDHVHSPITRILYGILLQGQKGNSRKIRYEEVKEIDKEMELTDRSTDHTEFYRGAEIVNWMLRYRWTTERDNVKPSDLNYYFSEIRDVFKFVALKVYSFDRKDYKGFVVFSFSCRAPRSVLKVLDYHFLRAEDHQYIPFLALRYGSIYGANYLEVPESLVQYMKGIPLMNILLQRKKRIYLFHPKGSNSPLATFSADIELNYCDGDTPFT